MSRAPTSACFTSTRSDPGVGRYNLNNNNASLQAGD